HGRTYTTFEYIVQGSQAGEWTLPSQEFTYFDTTTRKYRTLKTEPLVITITPSPLKKQHAPAVASPVSTALDTTSDIRDVIAPLHSKGKWYGHHEKMLPWWLFVIGFLAPL